MGASYSAPAVVKSKFFPAVRASLPSMSGKTIAITGCTSGTGYILAQTCVELGAHVVMLNRPSARNDAAKAQLQGVQGGGKVTSIPCDLTSFDSVRKAGSQLRQELDSLDVLCNNAGVMAVKDEATVDGYDIQMQTNHLSQFLLTSEVWPLLEKASQLRGEARIVNHSSGARNRGDWDRTLSEKHLGQNGGNLGGDKATSNVVPFTGGRWIRYQQTKLANVAFTYALHEQLVANGLDSRIKALVAHPGLSATNLQVTTAANGGMGQFFSNFLMGRAAQSAEDGTLGILRCCCSPSVKSKEFYGPAGLTGDAVLMPEEPLADKRAQEILWQKSIEATGAAFPFGAAPLLL